MSKNKYPESTEDELFLLEVLIDQVVLNQTLCLDGKIRTSVIIECLNKESLEICDNESLNSPTAKTHVRRFNCGKSCLFTIKQADIKKAIECFPIKVTVLSMLPCGCLPTKIVGGVAQIDMTKEFVQVYRTFKQDPTVVSYQAMKDTFQLINQEEPSGEITMFLRISCFGHHITTSFTGGTGHAERSQVFSGQLFDRMCNPPRTKDHKSKPCECSETGGEGICGVNENCPFMKDKYNVMPCGKDDICDCGLPASEHPNKAVCDSGHLRGPEIPQGVMQNMLCSRDRREVDVYNTVEKLFEGVNFSAVDSITESGISTTESEVTRNKNDRRSTSPSYKNRSRRKQPQYTGSTAVYLMINEWNQQHATTQATSLINKCLQTSSGPQKPTLRASTLNDFNNQVFYFGYKKKKDKRREDSRSRCRGIDKVTSDSRCPSTLPCTTQTCPARKASTATETGKSVSYKDKDKEKDKGEMECPAVADPEGTVSHIRILPRYRCNETCSGVPTCMEANGAGVAPVKTSVRSNARRGVFEIVVTKTCGAPLARNDLMLEWTVPPAPCSTKAELQKDELQSFNLQESPLSSWLLHTKMLSAVAMRKLMRSKVCFRLPLCVKVHPSVLSKAMLKAVLQAVLQAVLTNSKLHLPMLQAMLPLSSPLC